MPENSIPEAVKAKALELRRKYKRDWYQQNKEKQTEYNLKYWQRKAIAEIEESEHKGVDVDGDK